MYKQGSTDTSTEVKLSLDGTNEGECHLQKEGELPESSDKSLSRASYVTPGHPRCWVSNLFVTSCQKIELLATELL